MKSIINLSAPIVRNFFSENLSSHSLSKEFAKITAIALIIIAGVAALYALYLHYNKSNPSSPVLPPPPPPVLHNIPQPSPLPDIPEESFTAPTSQVINPFSLPSTNPASSFSKPQVPPAQQPQNQLQNQSATGLGFFPIPAHLQQRPAPSFPKPFIASTQPPAQAPIISQPVFVPPAPSRTSLGATSFPTFAPPTVNPITRGQFGAGQSQAASSSPTSASDALMQQAMEIGGLLSYNIGANVKLRSLQAHLKSKGTKDVKVGDTSYKVWQKELNFQGTPYFLISMQEDLAWELQTEHAKTAIAITPTGYTLFYAVNDGTVDEFLENNKQESKYYYMSGRRSLGASFIMTETKKNSLMRAIVQAALPAAPQPVFVAPTVVAPQPQPNPPGDPILGAAIDTDDDILDMGPPPAPLAPVVVLPIAVSSSNAAWTTDLKLAFDANARGKESTPFAGSNLLKIKDQLKIKPENKDIITFEVSGPFGKRLERYLVWLVGDDIINIQPHIHFLTLDSAAGGVASNDEKLGFKFDEEGAITSVHREGKPEEGKIPAEYLPHAIALRKLLIKDRITPAVPAIAPASAALVSAAGGAGISLRRRRGEEDLLPATGPAELQSAAYARALQLFNEGKHERQVWLTLTAENFSNADISSASNAIQAMRTAQSGQPVVPAPAAQPVASSATVASEQLMAQAIRSGGVVPFALILDQGSIFIPENLIILKNALNQTSRNGLDVNIGDESYKIWTRTMGTAPNTYQVINIQESNAWNDGGQCSKIGISITDDGKILSLVVNDGSIKYSANGVKQQINKNSRWYYASNPAQAEAILTIMSQKAPIISACMQRVFLEKSVSQYFSSPLSIQVVANALRVIPNWHLNKFIESITPHVGSFMLPSAKANVNFSDNALQPGPEIDAGGPSQEFLNLLFGSLCDNNNFVSLGGGALGVKMPTIAAAMKPEDAPLFENLGKALALCYLSPRYEAGQYFHNALFAGICSLSENIVKGTTLNNAQRIALYTALNMQYRIDGQEDELVDAMIAFLNGIATDASGKNYREFLFQSAFEADEEIYPEEFKTEKDGETTLNLAAINTPAANQFLQKFINDTLAASSHYGQTVEPIHHIAKGLLSFVNKAGQSWSSVTAAGGEPLSNKIQGVLTKEALITALTPSTTKALGAEPLFLAKVEWLTEWINETDEENWIKLIVFITGKRGLGVGKKLKLQRVLISQPLPTSHTCFDQLDLSALPGGKITGVNEASKIAFKEYLEEAIAQEGFSMG